MCESDGIGGMNFHVECCKKIKRQKLMEMGTIQTNVKEHPQESTSGVPNQAAIDADSDSDDEAPAIISLADTHLQCPICMEVFFMATSLNCGHTFCNDCIVNWRKKNKHCPLCRNRIKHMATSNALDQFITEMFGMMDQEGLQRRKDFVKERKDNEEKAKGKGKGKGGRK